MGWKYSKKKWRSDSLKALTGKPAGKKRPYDGCRRDTEPGLGGMADGVPGWLDEPSDVPRVTVGVKNRIARLKCLGNAVVPQQFYPVFAAIAEIERGKSNG